MGLTEVCPQKRHTIEYRAPEICTAKIHLV